MARKKDPVGDAIQRALSDTGAAIKMTDFAGLRRTVEELVADGVDPAEAALRIVPVFAVKS